MKTNRSFFILSQAGAGHSCYDSYMSLVSKSAITQFITQSLDEAAVLAQSYFGKVTGTTKSDDNNQVLTQADLAIGKLIISRLKAHYPDHNIIDEEAGVIDERSRYTWVVDPIDGTSNFASNVPTYGIMLGLLEDNHPKAGGIVLPFFKERYVAYKDGGASCNDKPIHVTHEVELLHSLVAYGIDGHQEQPALTSKEASLLGNIVLGIRNLRSSNSIYDGCLVARGAYGATLNRTSKIWDNVAQHIIIVEAGGVYTDFWGVPMDYTNPLAQINNTFTWCAGAPTLHSELQTIIHAAV